MHAHSNYVLFSLHAEIEAQASLHNAEKPEAVESVLAPKKQADAWTYTGVYAWMHFTRIIKIICFIIIL